ncbi:MAG: zinc-dependent alcohol dehydrogenase [Octadecabacter sp.]
MTTPNAAQAFWVVGDRSAEIRKTVYDAAPDHLHIETLFTGISRGTERLVFNGRVPPSEHSTMRAPFQEGDFTYPLKYGYSAVGQIENGARRGEPVFALFPHQDRFSLPADAVIAVPDNVPVARAILAANMETALNICWDGGIGPGDKVAVVGCGVIGLLTSYIAARIAGTEVTAIDVDLSRAGLADALGFGFNTPDMAVGEQDVVIHCSASAAGLETAINLAGTEAKIVEASWFGTGTTAVPLGGRFHQRRLCIVGSQVGRIPARQASRWTYQRRLKKAMSLLTDPALDTLISGETAFCDLPDHYGAILNDPATLCHRVRYGN